MRLCLRNEWSPTKTKLKFAAFIFAMRVIDIMHFPVTSLLSV